jgi:hypothetical protein
MPSLLVIQCRTSNSSIWRLPFSLNSNAQAMEFGVSWSSEIGLATGRRSPIADYP